MSTIRDVAKLADVSVGTVSRYLNGESLKKNNQEKIHDAIKQLDYHQNFIAKGLKNNRSLLIGVLVNSLTDVFATSIVSSIEQYVEKFGYSILVSDYHWDSERLEEKLNFLLKRSVDAIVIFHDEKPSPMLKRVNAMGIPIIAIDAPIADIESDSVLVNNRQATEILIQRLLENGFKSIGFIGGSDDNYIGRERLSGYKDALFKNGINVHDSLIWHGDYTIDAGMVGANELYMNNSNLDAIFAINYYTTLGVIKFARQKNIKIGRDIGLVAFDRFELNDFITPEITSMQQPVEEMGRAAGKLLMDHLLHSGQTMIESQTIICDTNLFVGLSDKKGVAF